MKYNDPKPGNTEISCSQCRFKMKLALVDGIDLSVKKFVHRWDGLHTLTFEHKMRDEKQACTNVM